MLHYHIYSHCREDRNTVEPLSKIHSGDSDSVLKCDCGNIRINSSIDYIQRFYILYIQCG